MKTNKNYFFTLITITTLLITGCADDPIPCFDYELTDPYTHTVKFSNCTDLGIEYEWDFGDGSTSQENNPEHTYAEAGEYTVTLKAFNEKRDAQITKNVKVDNAITMEFNPKSASSKWGETVEFDIYTTAINGVSRIFATHFYSDRKKVWLDTTFDQSDTYFESTISQKMPLIYRASSRYRFIVEDQEGESDTFNFNFDSGDDIDTLQGRVLSGTAKDIDPFDFTYSHGYAIWNKKSPQGNETISVYLFDSDGDYIKISDIVADEGTYTSYKVTAHDEVNGKTHEKEYSRSAANDFVNIETLDFDKMMVTGSLDMDVNLESQFHDVLKIDFAEIPFAIVDERL